MEKRYSLMVLALFAAAVPSLHAEPPRIQLENKSPVLCLAWSHKGDSLAIGAKDGTVRIIDAATGKEVHKIAAGGPVIGIALSPDGRTLAISQAELSISTWDIATATRLKTSTIKEYKGEHLAFTEDGQAVIGCSVGTSFQFQIKGGFSGSRTANPGAGAAGISPDGRVSGWANAKGVVQVREYNPSKAASLKLNSVNCLAFGPGGRLMAFGGEDKDVRLLDLPTKRETTRLTGLQSKPSKLSFSADGTALAALASESSAIRIWDVTRHTTRRQLNHNRGEPGAFALSPHGKVLATTAQDGKFLLLWDVGTRQLSHKGPPLELSNQELIAYWQDLTNTDYDKADAAWHKLAAAGDNAHDFLRREIRLVAVPPVDMKQIEKWVEELDSDKFAVRDRATKELIASGELAIFPLQRLLEKSPSKEAATRANLVLKKVREPVLTSERLRILEAIELLEAVRSPKTIGLLKEIERDSLVAQLRIEARRALERIETVQSDKK